jgi:ribonucleoside-diphosphate reductase alpha chain
MVEMQLVTKIKKRDGRLVDFDRNKITQAVLKAANSVGKGSLSLAEKISANIAERLSSGLSQGQVADVELIQDLVEKELVHQDCPEIAKAYILYREERKKIRGAKEMIGVADDELKLSINAAKVLERRYLKKDSLGNIIETPEGMFRRVARNIAQADSLYNMDAAKAEEEFFQSMTRLEFVPNSPTLMNAGRTFSSFQRALSCLCLIQWRRFLTL